jgi:hypothetical protein
MNFFNLQVGTTIKFKSWNDELMVGNITENDNNSYIVSINGKISKMRVDATDVVEIINKSKKHVLIKEEKPNEEEMRLAEEKRIEEERIAEEKRIEEERIAEEKRVEEERIAEEKRVEEEIRLKKEERNNMFNGFFEEGGIYDEKIIDNLPNELTIYIPLYDYSENPVSDEEIEKRVNGVKNFLKNNFGEFVVQNYGSSYIDQEGKLQMKKHIQISSYPTDDEFNTHKEHLINQISIWANEWLQELMVLEYEDEMYFIMPLQDKMKEGGELWIQDTIKSMNKKGTIHSFTKQAKREGLTPIEFAKKVLKNPKGYTLKTRRRAMFVRNTNPEKF